MKNENNLIVQSNSLLDLKYNSKYSYSKNELKIICVLISQIEKDDEDFKKKYIHIQDLNFSEEENRNYQYIKELCDDLMKKPLTFPKLDKNGKELKKSFNKYNWFSNLGYENGVIDYSFHPDLKPFLLNLKSNFTSYTLNNVLRLNSQYSIILYELLKQTEKLSKTKKFEITEFRNLLKIPESYQIVHIKSMIEMVKKDLKKTDLSFNVVYEKLGKSIKYIEFRINKNDENSSFKDFIKRIRDTYVNQTIIRGRVLGKEREISVNPKGFLYYLDSRDEITKDDSLKIWEYLYKNQDKINPYITKSLFEQQQKQKGWEEIQKLYGDSDF